MHFRFTLGLIGTTLSFLPTAHADTEATHLATLALDDISITATRTPVATQTITGDITVISREQIEQMAGSSLQDLLKRQPGLQITSNGGMGTASSVFIRGTNADQLVVLIDGLRVNSATLGTTSFENLPLGLIDRIEILRGPASSLYGADAIGGVIQIFTRRNTSQSTRFFGSVGAGSYDTYTGNAGFSSRYKALQFGAQINSIDTRGISAKKHPPLAVDKDRDGYHNLGGSAYANLQLAEGHSVDFNWFQADGLNHFDNGYQNYSTSNQLTYAAALKNQLTARWHSTLKYGVGRDRSYSVNSATSNSRFTTEQTQITWQNDIRFDLGTLTLAYDRLEQDVTTYANSVRSIDKTRNDDAFLLSFNGQMDRHSAQISIREDHNTQFGNYVTGGLGYGYSLTPAWRMTAQYGSAFKAPTFNQLFYPSFGDPTLQPEKSDNMELGLQYREAQVQAKLTAFDHHIRDLIQSTGPATSGCTFAGFCPINTGKARIQGATLESSIQFDEAWQLSGNITVQSPRDEATDQLLIRRSQRYGNLQLQYQSGPWQWGAELNAASMRYNDAKNTLRLPGYALLNALVSYEINPHWKLRARANNLLDKDYVLASSKSSSSPNAPDYQTYGANLFVSLHYDMQ